MTTRTPFLLALRELYRNAGEPSYRAVSYRTRQAISHTAVGSVLDGASFPRWTTLVALVQALRGDPNDFEDLWEEERTNRNESQKKRPPKIQEGLVIRPGDTVVLTVANQGQEGEDLDSYREDLAKAMPENVKVVLVIGATASVIRKGEEVAA